MLFILWLKIQAQRSWNKIGETPRRNENVPKTILFLTCCLTNKSAQRRKIFDTLLHPRNIARNIIPVTFWLSTRNKKRFWRFNKKAENILISQLISRDVFFCFLVWSFVQYHKGREIECWTETMVLVIWGVLWRESFVRLSHHNISAPA